MKELDLSDMTDDRKTIEGDADDTVIVWTSANPKVFFKDGHPVNMPEGWRLVRAGDAMITRRLKAAGEYWEVQKRAGKRIIRIGLCVPESLFLQVEKQVTAEREDPSYAKRKIYNLKRRNQKQAEYEIQFKAAVKAFLAFHPRWSTLEDKMAELVTDRSIAIGSGTVARTSMIPLERRAEAAVIAWMRHQTTDYDLMYIPRQKDRRREVRRELAAISRDCLDELRDDPDEDLLKKNPLFLRLLAAVEDGE